MIHPDSRTIEWMKQVTAENKFSDIALIEKSIRAFSLLESLVLSGCPFVFKGGTALMLHMDSAKRLSIDIDIICPPGTNIKEFVQKHAQEYGFGDVKLVERVTPHNISKTHAKFFYQVAPDTFKLLQTGTKRIQSFIHSEKYNIDSAITNASKAAYLSALIANGIRTTEHFDPQNIEPLRDAVINEPLPTKLNKLKKSNIEAFFYWNEIGKILNS